MGKIRVKDIYLNYTAYGEGKPILFLHGAYLSSSEWKYQISAFTKGYKAVLLDLPGHGESDNLTAYSVEIVADYVNSFIEITGIGSCIICGHSFGGMVAQLLAINYSSIIEKLILVDTSYGIKSDIVDSVLTTLTMPVIKCIKVETQAKIYAQQMGKHNEEVKKYVYTDISKHSDNPQNYKKIWSATASFNSKRMLHKISCPTLIIVGGLNTQTHKQAKYMRSVIPDSKLLYINDAGHMLNMENPVDFNREVKSFMS